MSEIAKHTQGEWRATKGYSPTVVADDGSVIAGLIGGKAVDSLGGVRLGEVDTNARMISAAPELLQAVNRLVIAYTTAIMQRPGGTDSMTDAERAVMQFAGEAIRKATGT